MKTIIILILCLSLIGFEQAKASDIKNCSHLHSVRMGSEDVMKQASYDRLLNSFYLLPVFKPYEKRTEMLKKLKSIESENTFNVDCLEKETLHFSIVSSSNNIKGFYILKNNKYWSGPFADIKIKAIIQADPRSRIPSEESLRGRTNLST
jgi:hypothetical protein